MGDNRVEVYKLKKELQFWRDVYEYDAPSRMEDILEEKILQLSNFDEFGQPRYNGRIQEYEDEDENYYDNKYTSNFKMCKLCKECGLTWGRYNNTWRLFKGSTLHSCKKSS